MCIYVYNTSEVSYNITFMCMRLKHWDKDEAGRNIVFLGVPTSRFAS
jgi:hypothetical protein